MLSLWDSLTIWDCTVFWIPLFCLPSEWPLKEGFARRVREIKRESIRSSDKWVMLCLRYSAKVLDITVSKLPLSCLLPKWSLKEGFTHGVRKLGREPAKKQVKCACLKESDLTAFWPLLSWLLPKWSLKKGFTHRVRKLGRVIVRSWDSAKVLIF